MNKKNYKVWYTTEKMNYHKEVETYDEAIKNINYLLENVTKLGIKHIMLESPYDSLKKFL